MQRLDKVLSEVGLASRKELKQIIRSGRVSVDGVIITASDCKVDETVSVIKLDGEIVETMRPVLLMLHKPAGYVTATEDLREKTVMELLPEKYRRLGVKPAGRLDKETEGLLLLTNDGNLAHKIISPNQNIWKTYLALHEGIAAEEDIAAFQQGITLEDGTACLPAELSPVEKGKSIIKVCEGKYHQVRRMMASRHMPVTYLKRLSVGRIQLDDLPLGECKEISPDDL